MFPTCYIPFQAFTFVKYFSEASMSTRDFCVQVLWCNWFFYHQLFTYLNTITCGKSIFLMNSSLVEFTNSTSAPSKHTSSNLRSPRIFPSPLIVYPILIQDFDSDCYFLTQFLCPLLPESNSQPVPSQVRADPTRPKATVTDKISHALVDPSSNLWFMAYFGLIATLFCATTPDPRLGVVAQILYQKQRLCNREAINYLPTIQWLITC